jgi:hypothetical protein
MRAELAEISGEEHLPRKISVKILSEEAPPPSQKILSEGNARESSSSQKILVNVIEGKVN